MEAFRSLTFAILLSTLGLGAQQPASPRAIAARVDPRIELLSVVARLADFREFNMDNSKSPYADDVERHFGPHREHAAVVRLRELRALRSVCYDAIPSLAVHLDGIGKLGERVPFDAPPERLDERWGLEGSRAFLDDLRDFAAQTHAAEFFAAHGELFEETGKRLSARLSESRAIAWFDSFFGARPNAKYTAIAGLLCGGGNFGVGVRFPDGTPEEITPVFGCWVWDEKGVPVFGEQYLPLFVHELCHSYTNVLVDRFERELAEAGAALYASCEAQMKRQAYGNWATVLRESLVRACVVRCRLATEGKPAAEEQARAEMKQHFVWVPELAKLLGEYETCREAFPTIDAFMPRVIEFFQRYAEKLAEDEANRPQLLSLEPENGAADVDPTRTTLVIRFDRPMLDQSWSITGGTNQAPEITGKLAYDAERKVLTIPVRLEPGRAYGLWLNGPGREGFKSAEGVALAPVEVSFTTRAAK